MGKSFLFNSKQATPIFVLRKSGQIDCVIEYEKYDSHFIDLKIFSLYLLFKLNEKFSSKNFENLSSLNILPYNLENESQQQIVTYLVTRTSKIKCLALLMEDGTIHHCIFMPNVKTSAEVSRCWFSFFFFSSFNLISIVILKFCLVWERKLGSHKWEYFVYLRDN